MKEAFLYKFYIEILFNKIYKLPSLSFNFLRKSMVQEMERRGYIRKRNNKGKGFANISLISELPDSWVPDSAG